ncbi:MAG TPA: extracellular solute-binding protein [Candidatus Binatia bacterium]|jgi:iron(III) transport system substrate-binding protein
MTNALKTFAALGFLLLESLFHPSRVSAAETKGNWQAEWEKTVRAAEQEGQVSFYVAGYEAIIESGIFQKSYPKIKVVTVTGSGTQLAPRIASERRAGKYLADVYNGGGNSLHQTLYLGKMLDPIRRALILPEVLDESKWWEGKHKYVDPEGMYVFVYEGNVSAGGGLSYNTNLLNPKNYKSYWDFLDPKLKGKIVAADLRQVRGAGLGWQYLYYHPQLGPAYIKRLYGEMDVTMSADLRQAVDWMATGKVVLCIPCQGSGVIKARNQGLPVDQFQPYHFKEGVSVSSGFGQLALLNRAPHPNAAKVFINWFLSREGQTAFQKIMSQPGDPQDSRRIDVPKDHIPPEERRKDGMRYFDIDDPETKDIQPITKFLNEILAGK